MILLLYPGVFDMFVGRRRMDNPQRVFVFHNNNVINSLSSLLIHRNYPMDSSSMVSQYDAIQGNVHLIHTVQATSQLNMTEGEHTHASFELIRA